MKTQKNINFNQSFFNDEIKMSRDCGSVLDGMTLALCNVKSLLWRRINVNRYSDPILSFFIVFIISSPDIRWKGYKNTANSRTEKEIIEIYENRMLSVIKV